MAAPEVVVAVDGSGPSRDAVDIGIYEAFLRGLPLTLIHVQPRGASGRRTARSARLLDAAQARANQTQPDLAVTTSIGTGPVRARLIAASATATVMVIGRRHGPLTALRAATLTGALVRHAACPVIVAQGISEPIAPIVAVASDDPASVDVLRFAFAEAAMRHASVNVVLATVIPVAVRVMAGGGAAANTGPAEAMSPLIAEALTEVRTLFPAVSSEVTSPGPAAADAVLSASTYAQLIVVARAPGARHHGRQGDTVERLILRHAMCPIAVIATNAAAPATP